jgi:NTP pyrophosphatase (non-canonical NTP hydrolase)
VFAFFYVGRSAQQSDTTAHIVLHDPLAGFPHNGPHRRVVTARRDEEVAMSEALRALQQRVAAFAAARDWERFHSPKNLAMALSVEAAELVEEFQWLTEDQSRALDGERLERVRLELADVFIYLLRIADKLDVDLVAAASDKIVLNEKKYPPERVRGDARKYSEYD